MGKSALSWLLKISGISLLAYLAYARLYMPYVIMPLVLFGAGVFLGPEKPSRKPGRREETPTVDDALDAHRRFSKHSDKGGADDVDWP